MNSNRIEELVSVYRDGLFQDVLPFWLEHCVDREHGGFTFCLGRDGSVIDTDKGVWHQGRFTWLLSRLYNTVEKRPEWLALAKHGIDFISKHCIDPADGRMWFHVTREGRPIRKRRYAFSEAFASIAYGEYARASADAGSAAKAHTLFDNFVGHRTGAGLALPKFTDTRPMKSFGVPMITIGVAQELRDSVGLPQADEWIDRSIKEIRRDFMKPDIPCVMETVGPNGEIIDHFDGRMLCPGHAIEGAWFILREAKQRGDEELVRMGCSMLDWMWQWGWDPEYGGLFYYRDVRDLPVQEYWHDMKFWWPHNEAIIATLLGYQLTGNEKYAQWHSMVHDWSYSHFPDRQCGEWFGYLHRDGSMSVDLKGNLWKGPFHLPRMQLFCWQILAEMRAAEGQGIGGKG